MLHDSGRTLTDRSHVELNAIRCLTPAGDEFHALMCRLFFLLRTGPGTAVVGGPKMLIPTCPPMQSFARMSHRQREGILQYWATGPIPLLRKVWRQRPDMHAAWQHSHVIPHKGRSKSLPNLTNCSLLGPAYLLLQPLWPVAA